MGKGAEKSPMVCVRMEAGEAVEGSPSLCWSGEEKAFVVLKIYMDLFSNSNV